MPTPYWISDTTLPQQAFFHYDVIALDANPPVINALKMQLGITPSGEDSGLFAEHFQPFGFMGVPVISTLGNPAGTELIGWWREDGPFSFAGRDTVNQWKAGTVNPGETALYSPGAQGINRIYLDINGNVFVSVQNTINLVSAANQINLGSLSPSDQASRASITNSNFSNIISACQSAITAATPNDGGKAAFTAFMNALSFPSVASSVVNLSG
jgi:hypothetical protein